MKLIWITLTVGFSVLTVTAVFGQENVEYDYEDEAPSAPVQRGRSPLLSSRQSKAIPANNNNKIKSAAGKPSGAKASPTKAAAPIQEEQDEYQDEYDQPAEEPVEVTSTEAPKKTIKPIVRPFRSNDDLLAALKRRRQQVQNSGVMVDKATTTTSTTTSAPSSHKKSSNSFGSGRRGRNGSNNRTAQPAEPVAAEGEPPKKSPQPRRYSSRGSGRATSPVEEEKVVEEQPQQPQAKPKFGRGSRRPSA